MFVPFFLVIGCMFYSLSFELSPSLMNFSFIHAKYFCSKMEKNDQLGVCSSYEDYDKDIGGLSLQAKRVNQSWKSKQSNRHYATKAI